MQGSVLIPRYYDPEATEELRGMARSCDLVTIGDLVREGQIDLETGDEVGKLAYGGGDVSFVRTSDFGNWELKHDPKQRVSRDVYDTFAAKQSAMAADVLLVRDGTYLVGTTTIVQPSDLPLLFSGGIYRLRLPEGRTLRPSLLLALLNMGVVRRQMRNKQFTRDVIDTLGHRILEVVLPIPRSSADRDVVSRGMDRLLSKREQLRVRAQQLATDVEAA
jgi:type I restriction enzyme M protein